MNIQKVCFYICSVLALCISSMCFATSSSSSSNNLIVLIQAENYSSMSGIQTQTTTDVGGGLNVGYINAGDWLSYAGTNVSIPATRSYIVTYRVAGSGSFTLKEAGGATYDTVSFPATGGWQTWVDVKRTITLTGGIHNFDITALSAGFNINWFKIESVTGSSSSSKSSSKSSSSSSASSLTGTLLFSEDFESPILPAAWEAFNGGTAVINTNTSQNYNGSAGSFKGTYPLAAGIFVQGNYDLSPYTVGGSNHVYVDFYAKMPNSKQGLKFCKLLGTKNGEHNYANTTFGMDYTGADRGGMVYVGFGDGNPETNTIENDTYNGVWLAGINDWDAPYHGVGRSKNSAVVLTPQNAIWSSSNWGTSWHRFQFYVKFNSGTTQANEVNDGEMLVIIDGVKYVDAKGLFNRHYSNGPLNYVHLLEYAQGATSPFDVWVDSLRISQNGWTR